MQSENCYKTNSFNLNCVATANVYTRSMFISLGLSSELISGYLFSENAYL